MGEGGSSRTASLPPGVWGEEGISLLGREGGGGPLATGRGGGRKTSWALGGEEGRLDPEGGKEAAGVGIYFAGRMAR